MLGKWLAYTLVLKIYNIDSLYVAHCIFAAEYCHFRVHYYNNLVKHFTDNQCKYNRTLISLRVIVCICAP